MKNKILIASLLFVFILAGGVNAAGTGNSSNNNSADKGQQQQLQDGSEAGAQVQNQGEETQLQENIQNQITTNNPGAGVQEKQQLQDGSEAGAQVQNQGEETQLKNNSDNDSQQRKNRVSSAVQEMLQVSERNGGIGEQVRVVAQNQNQNQVELESILEKVQSRNNFTKFFIGSDYKAIDNAEAILGQSNQQIQELIQVKNQLENEGDREILAEQIRLLENVNVEIKNILNDSQKGFSLLGWMFKLFAN